MTARLRAPGLSRAFLFLAIGTVFCAAIIVVFREWYDLQLWTQDASPWIPIAAGVITLLIVIGLIANRAFLVTLSMLALVAWAVAVAIWGIDIEVKAQNAILLLSMLIAPLWFLIGLGAFDYWFYWAAGKPTVAEDHSGHGAYSWKDYFRINTDHKVIGIQYVVTSFFFMLVGGLLAMLVRAELATPGRQFVDANAFNGLFSVHASLMIFLFIIPVFAGLANYVLPLMIGAPDMAFPRLNALSFWMLPIAGIMMTASFFAPGGSFSTGWTAYAPLSTSAPIGQMFFTIGVQFAGASSIATALNFLVTIITMRAPGMSFWRMPLLVWANFSTSLLVVIATPFIAASQFFVLFDYALGFNFFNPNAGGDVLMYQHVFWFYSHPAVYIMMLPGFGIVSVEKDIHYEVDIRKRTVGVHEVGVELVEDQLGIDNLYEAANSPLVSYLNNAIKAKELFTKDKDYIVRDGEVIIVDEFTGRVLVGRRYNEGMHQAIEAKEKVEIKAENQTLATITLQNYFRLYDKLVRHDRYRRDRGGRAAPDLQASAWSRSRPTGR